MYLSDCQYRPCRLGGCRHTSYYSRRRYGNRRDDNKQVNIPIVFGALNKAIIIGGKPLEVVYTFNWLSGTGTAILLAGLITAFILRIKAAELYRIFADTLKNLRFALLTIALVLGFSYVANWSGMTPTLGKAFTVAGAFFPFLSAFLGWLGVLITGSDTSSNALFAKMQQVTAQSTGINPVLTVAADSSGGVMGKMISPQSIVVGTSSTGLTGREGDLFRFTLPHSIFLTVIVGLITVLQAYVFPSLFGTTDCYKINCLQFVFFELNNIVFCLISLKY